MFTPIKNVKVYEQVVEQIKKMVEIGELKKGDKLPSERELVSELNVSRSSIREALRSLEIIGLIECKRGEGNFIRKNFENNLFEPLHIIFMLEKSTSKDVMEVRQIIETESAALASKNIKDKDISILEDMLLKLKNCNDEKKSIDLDKKFHYKIAEMSNNFILLSIMNACSGLIDLNIKGVRDNIILSSDKKEELVKQHEKIFLALKNKDSSKAYSEMRKHMKFSNDNLLL